MRDIPARPEVVDFAREMAALDRRIDEIYSENLDGETLLATVFLGDLELLCESLLREATEGRAGSGELLESVLRQIEEAMTTRPKSVVDAIEVGFVEALPYPGDERRNTALIDRLGPGLAASLERQRPSSAR